MAKDATYTKTPQSGSKPPYAEPTYSRTAQTIPQKLRNNKGGNIYGETVYPGNTQSPTGGGGASSKGRKQTDSA